MPAACWLRYVKAFKSLLIWRDTSTRFASYEPGNQSRFVIRCWQLILLTQFFAGVFRWGHLRLTSRGEGEAGDIRGLVVL